jgi:hypothetical protein
MAEYKQVGSYDRLRRTAGDPLPVCIHGNHVIDHSFSSLAPVCGCTKDVFLDPDYRKDPPKNSRFCVRCQKAIKPGQPVVQVTVDYDKMEVKLGGTDIMGMNCAKIIGLI